MIRYVRITLDTTAAYQPATRSWGVGGIIGESSTGPTDAFLLTYPGGTEYDALESNSPLKIAIDSFYAQPNTMDCWCVRFRSGAGTTTVSNEVPSPLPNGVAVTFQLQNANITSIDALDINGTVYTYAATPGAGEYSQDLTLGQVTIGGDALASGATINVDYTIDALQSSFRALRDKDIQLEMIAGCTTLTQLMQLVDEVTLASASSRYRIAFGMLPSGQPLTSQLDDEGYQYRNWIQYLQSPRMSLVAHKIPADAYEDAAANVMGVAAGLKPWRSLTLRPVQCTQIYNFTDTELRAFYNAQCIVLDDPYMVSGTGKYITYGFNLSGDSALKYVDTMRVLDDLAFILEAGLTNPNIIGMLKYNSTGLDSLKAHIMAILQPRVDIGEFEAVTYINIPVEVYIDKQTRSEVEELIVRNAKVSRTVSNISVGIDYRGAIEGIDLELVVV